MSSLRKFFFALNLTLILTLSLFTSYVYAMSTHRIAGDNRYLTATRIAEEGWQEGSNWAILAYGGNYPDALTATPLAAKLNAPILLTESHSLTPVTKATLNKLGTKNVIIVGGPNVISHTVENQLKNSGISTKRLAGKDRYETSVLIAKELNSSTHKLIVTTGSDFSNALSISSYAGKNGIPIVLVSKNNVSDSIKNFLATQGIQETFVIGNTNDISESVKNVFPNPTRIYGNDKYGTNLAVIEWFKDDYNFDTVFMATGNDYPDALAGAAYASKSGSPILLADRKVDSRIVKFFNQ